MPQYLKICNDTWKFGAMKLLQMLFAIFVDIVITSHDQEVFAGTSQYIEVLEYLDGWFIVLNISFGYLAFTCG
jgi:hypothetical protein